MRLVPLFSALGLVAVFAVTVQPTPAKAGPLDGLAGAAVGFALGAMVAGQRPAYAAPRGRRVVHRQAPRRHVAQRSRPVSPRGAAISTVSDPFAGSGGGAKPIPVAGN